MQTSAVHAVLLAVCITLVLLGALCLFLCLLFSGRTRRVQPAPAHVRFATPAKTATLPLPEHPKERRETVPIETTPVPAPRVERETKEVTETVREVPTRVVVSSPSPPSRPVEMVTESTLDECHVSVSPPPPAGKVRRPGRIRIPSVVTATAGSGLALESEIPVRDFLSRRAAYRAADDAVIEQEFELLSRVNDETRAHSYFAASERNDKNRFQDIMPFDDNRVKLQSFEGDDYINASFIEAFGIRHAFIAAQGPIGKDEEYRGDKKSTVEDFWRMIYEQRVRSVVNLTLCTENMKVKCAAYWPSSIGERLILGELAVSLIDEETLPFATLRHFELSAGGQRRVVRQYHFTSWSDGHAPSSPRHLLRLVERIDVDGLHTPCVVHCSAGVGRSGVFIALCQLLRRLSDRVPLDVFATVRRLREQRARMVQTEEQYRAIYDVLEVAIEEQGTAYETQEVSPF